MMIHGQMTEAPDTVRPGADPSDRRVSGGLYATHHNEMKPEEETS
jgi:hypothetical protein